MSPCEGLLMRSICRVTWPRSGTRTERRTAACLGDRAMLSATRHSWHEKAMAIFQNSAQAHPAPDAGERRTRCQATCRRFLHPDSSAFRTRWRPSCGERALLRLASVVSRSRPHLLRTSSVTPSNRIRDAWLALIGGLLSSKVIETFGRQQSQRSEERLLIPPSG